MNGSLVANVLVRVIVIEVPDIMVSSTITSARTFGASCISSRSAVR